MLEEPDHISAETPPVPSPAAPVSEVAQESASLAPAEEVAPEDEVPDVDALQGRLAELQSAMDQLQSGDLDGAEATIAALEDSLSDARQEHGLT